MPRYTTRPDLFPGEPFPHFPCSGRNSQGGHYHNVVGLDTDTGEVRVWDADTGSGLSGGDFWVDQKADKVQSLALGDGGLVGRSPPLTLLPYEKPLQGWYLTGQHFKGANFYQYKRLGCGDNDGCRVRAAKSHWLAFGVDGVILRNRDGVAKHFDTAVEAMAALEEKLAADRAAAPAAVSEVS